MESCTRNLLIWKVKSLKMCLKKLQKRIILKRLLVVGLRKVLNVLSFFVYKNQILAIITN